MKKSFIEKICAAEGRHVVNGKYVYKVVQSMTEGVQYAIYRCNRDDIGKQWVDTEGNLSGVWEKVFEVR